MFSSFRTRFTASPDPLQNLLAYWRLEESGASDRADQSGNSYTLQAVSSPANASAVIGNGCVFDGANDYLRIKSASSSDLNITGALSVSCWFKIDTTGSFHSLIGKWQPSPSQQYLLRVTNTETVQLLVSGTGADVYGATTTSTVSTGTWYHVFACYDPSNSVKIYLNGVLEQDNTTSIPASLYSSPATFALGVRAGNSAGLYLDGMLDEAGVWNASRPELASLLYNGGLGKQVA